MNDYLTKPLDRGRLSAALARWLPALAADALDAAS
jgi:hypothetical protein